jgi:II/X family phage/plasmid replication protein
MLIDWITGRVSSAVLGAERFCRLRDKVDRIQRFNPESGTVLWEMTAWDSVRSDSHSVSFRFGSDDLWIQGSPARSEGDGCNVFGGPICQSLDHIAALQMMINKLGDEWFEILPSADLWKVSRIDVTENYDLGNLANVRTALNVLRGVEGGRYRITAKAGDTNYWNSKSTIVSGKAYAKGPEIENQRKKGKHAYSDDQIAGASRLLRLELSLKRHFFRDNPDFNSDVLRERHTQFFSSMVGTPMPSTDYSILELLKALPEVTEGQAKAVFATWCMLNTQQWEQTRALLPDRTYYRHIKILKMIGLGQADISAGKVVSLRRDPLVLRPVTGWHQLAA